MTLILLLYLYFVMVGFFVLFSLFVVYHLFKFGFYNLETYVFVLIYVGVASLIIFATFYYGASIDWSTPLFEGIRITLPTSL